MFKEDLEELEREANMAPVKIHAVKPYGSDANVSSQLSGPIIGLMAVSTMIVKAIAANIAKAGDKTGIMVLLAHRHQINEELDRTIADASISGEKKSSDRDDATNMDPVVMKSVLDKAFGP